MIFGFDLALNWHLLEYVLALYWICYSMFSVVIVRGIIARITCLKFSLLSFSEIQRLFEDREICVFFGNFNVTTPQRRSSQHTHTLTNTNTHTHAWPTVASRASGSRGVFFGFCKYFLTTCGQQEFFWARKGVTQHPKIFPEC